MIKYDISNSVVSAYNPILNLHPYLRRIVNNEFIEKILLNFFEKKGGIENFEPLDNDILTTDIEFNDVKSDESYVKSYIYKVIIDHIEKKSNGEVLFMPKYAITFDRDLASNKSEEEVTYPYTDIFANRISAYDMLKYVNLKKEGRDKIRFGVIKLGNKPILYIIFIDLQEIIRFIKTIKIPKPEQIPQKYKIESQEETKLRLFDDLIRKIELKRNKIYDTSKREELAHTIYRLRLLREEKMQGDSGEFRVNLTWQTTDDLDLHIKTPNGTIKYDNKLLEHQGVIGELDVDQNAGNTLVSNPQENVKWNNIPIGRHVISVNLYKSREGKTVPFVVTIISSNGEGIVLNSFLEPSANQERRVASFEFLNGKLLFDDYSTV